MSWASRRRTTYLTGVILFFALVIGGPLAYHFLTVPPTCFDGIQNQGETAVDKGGPCFLLDERYLQPSAALWARSFKVRDGTYTAVAAINDPNEQAGVADVHYRFSLYDSQNVLVTTREGHTFIMPGAVTPVLESRIDTGNRLVAHTYFELTEVPVWKRMQNAASALSISDKQLTDVTDTPRLTAVAHNISVSDVIAPAFVAVVYDSAGNAFAASETQLDRLNANSSAGLTFTWPSPFAVQPGRVDIMPLVPPALAQQ
jgi:hypothetical protein